MNVSYYVVIILPEHQHSINNTSNIISTSSYFHHNVCTIYHNSSVNSDELASIVHMFTNRVLLRHALSYRYHILSWYISLACNIYIYISSYATSVCIIINFGLYNPKHHLNITVVYHNRLKYQTFGRIVIVLV